MRTDRSSSHLGGGGVGLAPPLRPDHHPPLRRDYHHPPREQTDARENITFPASLRYAVGNYYLYHCPLMFYANFWTFFSQN